MDIVFAGGFLLFLFIVPATFALLIIYRAKVINMFKIIKSKFQSSITFSFAFNIVLGIILCSTVGVLTNMIVNNEAFCFQWGMTRRIDTTLLKDYKLIRNIFLFVGVGVGILSTVISQIKGTRLLKQCDEPF